MVITVRGRPIAVMGFTVTGRKIAEIDAIADPGRVRAVAATPGRQVAAGPYILLKSAARRPG